MSKESPVVPERNAQSADLVRIVGVFYALVLGQTIINNHYLLLDPERDAYSVAALGLLVAFTGAAWQYLRFSLNIERTPYDVRWISEEPRTVSEEVRFAVDLAIAAAYAFLLVQCIDLVNLPRTNLWGLFATLLAINAFDFISTLLVRHHWELRSIRERWSIASRIALLWPAALLIVYLKGFGQSDHKIGFNLVVLGIAVAALNARELIERKAAKVCWARARTRPPAEVLGDAVYLASPLGFSEATWDYYKNVLAAGVREAGWGVLDPWDISDGERQILEYSRGSTPNRLGLRELDRRFGQQNVDMIDRCSAVLAVLDGSDVDSGTAAEIGYASAKGKRIIGLRLDTRVSGDNEGVTVNLQVEHFLSNRDDIARSLEAAIHALGRPSGM